MRTSQSCVDNTFGLFFGHTVVSRLADSANVYLLLCAVMSLWRIKSQYREWHLTRTVSEHLMSATGDRSRTRLQFEADTQTALQRPCHTRDLNALAEFTVTFYYFDYNFRNRDLVIFCTLLVKHIIRCRSTMPLQRCNVLETSVAGNVAIQMEHRKKRSRPLTLLNGWNSQEVNTSRFSTQTEKNGHKVLLRL